MTPTLLPLSSLAIASERDVVSARQRARQLASLLGFPPQDQARLATATSEICRNAFRYAGKGRCEFLMEDGPRGQFLVRMVDKGPGIRNLEEVLAGRYQSGTGMGLGIIGSQRLMDRFSIESSPDRGTEVLFGKSLPTVPPGAVRTPARIAEQLARAQPESVDEEVRQADRELLRAIAELRARNEELEQIRGELEETNRGVVALYAELDQKAESLRKATELKSRFLSNMSHEFRTPLNSIQSLARIVLDGSEGPLSDGQRKAVQLIRKSALDLAEMVNDLLDLAKIEAGKIAVWPTEFEAAELLGSLRAVLRPLIQEGSPVQLVFEPPPPLPPLYTDEGKLTQIVRNFASNALKFTERGEVRVGAREIVPGTVTFYVKDTGIGIAGHDQEVIFEEFTQVEGARQKKVKGTGLGLPLSRKLATLLGGEISVESEPGRGSTFSVTIPRRYAPQDASAPQAAAAVVAVVDDAALLAQWSRFLEGSRFRLLPARTLDDARASVARERPAALIAGAFLGGAPTRPLLAELRKDEATRGIPVIGYIRAAHEARLLSLGAEVMVERLDERHQLLEAISRALLPPRRVLLIAREGRDELRAQLSEPRVEVLEARDGTEGVRRARERRPWTVVLDASAPGFAEEALELLRQDPETRGLPVLVRAARQLTAEEAQRLKDAGAHVVSVHSMLRDDATRALRGALWEPEGAHA
jgi:signal transduction histidine kinase/anti-sigma regulatory factor (Ser/Thr protein kinase)/DNA-binding response OmpR family regulator